MSEINGTSALIYRMDNGVRQLLVGQLEITTTASGSPIDISCKTYGDNVTLLDGQLSGEQLTLSGVIVYNNDSTFQQMRTDRFSGVETPYELDYGNDKTLYLDGILDSMGESLPYGAAAQLTFSLASSGGFLQNYTPVAGEGVFLEGGAIDLNGTLNLNDPIYV